MIVKQRDARPETIYTLEAQAARTRDKLKSAACNSAASRLRADTTTQAATDMVDALFGESDEWAVLHDLRICVGGHAVQINHLLIHNSLGIVCLDSRFLDYGLELAEQGQCHVISREGNRIIASPLVKMAKDIRMIRRCISDKGLVPGFGVLRQGIAIKGYVLTNPALRLSVDCLSPDKSIAALTSDGLYTMLWQQNLNTSKLIRRRLSAEKLYDLAARLADEHRPVFSFALLEHDSLVDEHTHSLLRSTG